MKYIFSDLDNTLLFDGEIGEKDLDAIKKWKSLGNKLIIVTGRGKNMMDMIFDKYPNIADYYILNNGALLLDGSKNIINKNIMDPSIAKSIIKDIDKEKFLVAIETEDLIYSIGEFKDDICPEIGEKTINVTEELLLNMDLDVIFLNSSPKNGCLEDAINFYKNLLTKYGNDVSIFRNKNWIDIISKGFSKAKGIENLLEIKNLKPIDVFVIGDSLNDISMLETYKNSYTFNSAEITVKEHSNYTIDNFYEMVDILLGK